MSFKDRLVDPSSPDRRPRKAAYALPTLFTAGNIFLGYISILRSFAGRDAGGQRSRRRRRSTSRSRRRPSASPCFLDGLDGRIARMTNTTSDFGREMDSLADVISFGIAPAVLAFAWGVQFVEPQHRRSAFASRSSTPGYFIAFLFLLCGAAGWRASTSRRIRSPRIPAGRTASISSACRFPRRPRWWPRWCSPAMASRLRGGRSRVAWLALLAAARLPDGEHVALLQLQGHQSQQGLFAADHHSGGRALSTASGTTPQPLLLAMATYLCGERHCDPHRRHPAPALAALHRVPSGASRLANRPTVALVGSESLLGREIRDIVATMPSRASICA